MKLKFLVLSAFSISFLVGCNNPNVPEITYTVVWKNYDGTILETDNKVKEGEMPHYNGSEPTKSKTPKYSYVFNGWSPELAPVYSNVEYTATFNETINKYTVTFNSDGGTSIPSQTVEYGSKATMPDEPIKTKTDEYTFKFDYWQDEKGGKFDFQKTKIEKDITLKAIYTKIKNKYTVTFNSDGGTSIPSQTVEYGSKATMPDEPIKTKTDEYTFKFDYWQDEKGGKFDFQKTKIEKDITLKAIYTKTKNKYTISWKNEGQIIDSGLLEYGANPTHTTPTHSKKEGHTYTFNGWFDTKGIQLTSSYKVTKNETFESKWTDALNKHTVKWVNDDTPATTLEIDLNVKYGTTPTYDQGKNPTSTKTKTGYHYEFTGWIDGDGKPYSSTYKMPDKDIIFTAQYKETINKYTVNFIAGANVTLSGTKTFSVDYKTTFGNISNKPTPSTITGYTLKDGFYKKNSSGQYEKVSDTFEITADIDFYALADINKYNVTFDLNGAPGTAPLAQTVDYNGKVTKPTDPIWEKYRFDGWFEKNGSVLKPNPWNFSTDVVVSNITLYAKWTEVTFATDSWSNLISYAEQGLDKLHEVYQDDCDNNTAYPGTLIGLEKNLQISGGKTHKVRVLDESHDILTSDTTKFAALTFEFSTLVSSATTGAALTTSYCLHSDLTYDNTWYNSNLAAAMISVSDVVNNSIGGGIKEVAKATVDIPSNTCKWYRSLCFPLSVTEIGASDEHAYSGEGTVYKYYEGDESQVKAKRIKKDVAGNTPTWYWLRTPEVGTTNSSYYVYNGTPIIGDPGYVAAFLTNMSLAVSCAFCI